MPKTRVFCSRILTPYGGPVLVIVLLLFNLTDSYSKTSEEEKVSPNVLFIIVDDLRPELPSYGYPGVYAPSIEQLADEGTVFRNAYVQYPVCGPSRCSMLTGLRPTRERFVDNSSMVDVEVPDILPLPQLFKEQGYYTISNGKVYHDQGNVMDGMDGWSEIPWEPHPGFWVWLDPSHSDHSYRGYKYRSETTGEMGPAWETLEVDDNAYPTGEVTDKTIQDLHRLAEKKQPFFLAVGYRKPHLPLNAPKKYWDLYEPEEFRLPDNFSGETRWPLALRIRNGELRNYGNIPANGKIPVSDWTRLLHGYYACISYTDEQIGRIMRELEKLDLSENTIVVIVGDHGYFLGEFGIWGKNNPLRRSLRAPMVISVPWIEGQGPVEELVEFVDIYPTLVDLCGLELPDHLAGQSMAGLLKADGKKGKDAIFARVGHAEVILTARYAYTEWQDGEGRLYGRMLFDHHKDPEERFNLIGDRDYKPTADSLALLLKRHLSVRR